VGTIDVAALVRQHLKPLVLFARQWDDSSAEDVAHDAFVRLAELVRDGKPPDNAAAWLYRVARNGAIDRLRKKRRQTKHAENCGQNDAEWFVVRETDGERLDNQIDGRMLTERLQELPLEQREVIVAHLWGGLTFREIVTLVGRPFSTVRRDFHKGLETIRESLKFSEFNL
jgi:RNA polymerase sigma-70 factor (ECF subfamily)